MIDVLVVGAGPTGLTLASELLRFGLKVRVVDRAPERSKHSKAMAVQARTLEVFEILGGRKLADAAVAAGKPARVANFTLDQQSTIRFELGRIESDYPFILVLEQSETERLLEEHLVSLGGGVERGQEVSEVQGGVVFSRATLKSGETIEARYIVGCDGAHSAVRKSLGLPFDGGNYRGDFLLADAHADWELPDGETQAFLSSAGTLICFPMKGERKFRFIVVLKEPRESSSPDLTFDELLAKATPLLPAGTRVHSPVWLSAFRVNHRMVPRFRVGRVFVAGDAAHIHSPAGGQGMNTGIQDAVALGWRLAYALGAGSSRAETLLESYSDERVPVARRVLRQTDFIFRQGLSQHRPVYKYIRTHVLPLLARLDFVRNRVASFVSETAIRQSSAAIVGGGAAGLRFREFRRFLPDLADRRHLLMGPESFPGPNFKHAPGTEYRVVRPDGIVAAEGSRGACERYARAVGLLA